MPKLYKVLWTLAILFIAITTIIFSFGIVLVGAVMLSLFGIYRHYFPKKRSPKYHMKPKMYTFGEVIDVKSEVIDVKSEVIDCTIEARKPKQ